MEKVNSKASGSAKAIPPINKSGIKAGNGKSLALHLRRTCIVAIAMLVLMCWSVPGQTATIDGGSLHSLSIKSDGTVMAWRYNGYGQSTVPADLTQVGAVAAGHLHSLALKPNGTVVAWGYNDYGQCDVPPGLNLNCIFKTPRKPISPGIYLFLLGD